MNRIHDGVIVLGEHDNCLKFANEPAVSIFKQLPERDLFDISTIVQQEEAPSERISKHELARPIFRAV